MYSPPFIATSAISGMENAAKIQNYCALQQDSHGIFLGIYENGREKECYFYLIASLLKNKSSWFEYQIKLIWSAIQVDLLNESSTCGNQIQWNYSSNSLNLVINFSEFGLRNLKNYRADTSIRPYKRGAPSNSHQWGSAPKSAWLPSSALSARRKICVIREICG